MNQRFVIKHLSIAVLIFLVLAMLFLCFYNDELNQRWLSALYYTKISAFIAYVFWVIQKAFKIRYLSLLAILMYAYFGFDLIHNLYYVYFGGWNDWIDRVTLGIFIVLLTRLLIWLRTTG